MFCINYHTDLHILFKKAGRYVDYIKMQVPKNIFKITLPDIAPSFKWFKPRRDFLNNYSYLL